MKRITLEESENYQKYIRSPHSGEPAYFAVGKDEKGWDEVFYFTKHNKIDNNSEEGSEYIYVLKNEYMPGILKIGYTYNDPAIRANQLYKTGVPTEFEVVFSVKCFNGMRIERYVHSKLKDSRVNAGREFFKVDLDEAVKIIEESKIKFG